MGTFENTYLNQLKKLEEENLRLKRIISESFPSYPGQPFRRTGSYPGKPYLRIGSEPFIDMPPQKKSVNDPSMNTEQLPKKSVYDHSTDLHPLNPLRVDDADTGSTHHPGQMPLVSQGFMPDPNEPLVTSQEKKRRELEGTIVRYPQNPKPSLKDILASGMPPPRGGAQVERPMYSHVRY